MNVGIDIVTVTPERYQMLRSHADVHDFVLCYADRFYADVPYQVRVKGPWSGTGRGEVAKLKPELRLALAEARYVLINCPEAVFKPEA
jgi:hypothetical protein